MASKPRRPEIVLLFKFLLYPTHKKFDGYFYVFHYFEIYVLCNFSDTDFNKRKLIKNYYVKIRLKYIFIYTVLTQRLQNFFGGNSTHVAYICVSAMSDWIEHCFRIMHLDLVSSSSRMANFLKWFWKLFAIQLFLTCGVTFSRAEWSPLCAVSNISG